jgi:hypothetical protein
MTSYLKMATVQEKAMGVQIIGHGNPDNNFESLCILRRIKVKDVTYKGS